MTFFRYTLSRLVFTALLALAATVMIYLLFDSVENSRIIFAYKASMLNLLLLAFLRLPIALYHLLPLAMLVAVHHVLTSMEREGEITILGNCAQSKLAFFAPFIIFSVAGGVGLFAMGEYYLPSFEYAYHQTIDISIKHKLNWGEKWPPRVKWQKGDSGIWYIEQVSPNALNGVTLFKFEKDKAHSELQTYKHLNFINGVWYDEKENADRKAVEGISEGIKQFQPVWLPPETMTINEVSKTSDMLELRGESFLPYRVEKWWRFAYPLFAVACPFVAFLFLRRKSESRAKQKNWVDIGEALLMAILCFAILSVGRGLALQGILAPAVALLIPVVFIWLFSGYSILRFSK